MVAQTTNYNLIALISQVAIVGTGVASAHLLDNILDASVVSQTATTAIAHLSDTAIRFLIENREIFKLFAIASHEDFGWLPRLVAWLMYRTNQKQ